MAQLIGPGPNQVPTNADLGSLAYQDRDQVDIGNGRAALDEYQKTFKAPKIKPTLNLPFAKMQTFDPRVTFTRASDAYEYKGDSVKAEENLALYSEQADNASWSKTAVTVLANQTLAPNGTNTSDLVAETTATSIHNLFTNLQQSTVGLVYTESLFAKKGLGATAPDWIQLSFPSAGFGAAQFANFNITTGTLGTVSGGTATITLSANGFYRLSFTATATVTNASGLAVTLFFTNNTDSATRGPSYTGQTTSDVFVWGAQLEQRSTLTDYQRTTDRIIQKYIDTYSLVTSNKPRFKEIDPVTKERKGLLVEEARTNSFLYSNDFTNAYWTKGNVTLESGVPSSIGSSAKVVANTSLNAHQISRSISLSAPYSISIYAKDAGARYLTVSRNAVPATSAMFDLQLGTIAIAPTGGTATIEPIDNGWYRLTLTDTVNPLTAVHFYLSNGTSLFPSFTGDGYSGIYISQAQLEVGSFATSPILTLGSAVTRALDFAEVPSANFGKTLDLGFSVYQNAALSSDNSGRFFAFIGGVNDVDFTQSTRTLNFRYGVTGDGLTDSSFVVNTYNPADVKVAVSVDRQALVKRASFNAQNFEDTSISQNPTFAPTALRIGQAESTACLNIHTKALALYPQALTAEELAFLTRNTNE